ncbi:MAG: aminotransferase class III-fold pyridoxal phosphate-dependent enzyme, partial [Actinomycetota bacterium]
ATTIGGGPVVCAAALAVIDTMKSLDLPSRAAQIGAYLEQQLRGLATTHEMVKGCRGKGLLLALELHSAVARKVVLKSLDQGLLVNDVTADAVRLSPPLIAEKSHCDQAIAILDKVLTEIEAERASE